MGTDLVQAGRCVGFEHALLLEDGQAGARQSPDGIRLGTVFFGQQLGGDDPGGVTYPLDADIRVLFLECLLVGLELFDFQRAVDRQLGGGLCMQGAGGEQAGGKGDALEHGVVPVGEGWASEQGKQLQQPCGLSPRAKRALMASTTGGRSARVSIR